MLLLLDEDRRMPVEVVLPVKQGLKLLYGRYTSVTLASVEVVLPVKQGLKRDSPECEVRKGSELKWYFQ